MQFLNHIDKNNLCSLTDKVLLAVSGGIDSMVMLHLFKQAGYNIGAVHCNFKLRGEESDGDEDFVNTTCRAHNIPIHITHFETKKYALENGLSTQMAARDLRYDYFNQIIHAHSYTHLATAHHLNDNLETILLNLIRGTGMDGLTGIAVKNGNIIRPLLFASRDQIAAYAAQHNVSWREDSSNISDVYQRNLIRNQVVPVLKSINTGFEDGFQHTLERLQGASLLMQAALQQFKIQAIHEKKDSIYIDKVLLASHPCAAVVLWETIKDKGFNYVQCKDITSQSHQPGKVFYSQTHQLTIDRSELILSFLANKPEGDVLIGREPITVVRGKQKLFCEATDKSSFVIQKDTSIAQLDADLLQFPLIWRGWKAGDKFIPLGMRLHKKISDFLIDAKVSLPEKEDVTILESGGRVVWIVGHRISDEFKITEKTNNVLKLCLETPLTSEKDC